MGVGLEVTRKIDDVPHRMAGDDASLELHLAFFGHCP
jgi:hypothetical protein